MVLSISVVCLSIYFYLLYYGMDKKKKISIKIGFLLIIYGLFSYFKDFEIVNGLNELILIYFYFYISGQYILFNKLFVHYDFYSNYKKLVNSVIALLPIIVLFFRTWYFCSFNHCDAIVVVAYLIYIILFIIGLLLTHTIIDIYDFFIVKTTSKTKRIIDIVGVIIALLILIKLLNTIMMFW